MKFPQTLEETNKLLESLENVSKIEKIIILTQLVLQEKKRELELKTEGFKQLKEVYRVG